MYLSLSALGYKVIIMIAGVGIAYLTKTNLHLTDLIVSQVHRAATSPPQATMTTTMTTETAEEAAPTTTTEATRDDDDDDADSDKDKEDYG